MEVYVEAGVGRFVGGYEWIRVHGCHVWCYRGMNVAKVY